MPAVVLDCWRSDQPTSLKTQIALKLLYPHLFINLDVFFDVFFSDIDRIGFVRRKIPVERKHGKQNKPNIVQWRDTYWRQRKQKSKMKQTKHEQ